MVGQIRTLTGTDISITDKEAMIQIRNGVRALKERLTEAQEATLTVNLETGGIDLSLTRDEFERLNANLFEAILRPVKEVLQNTRELIDDVVLSGGSCRIPCLQKLFYDFFGSKPLSFSFSECTIQAAIGAAVLGANLCGYEDEFFSDLVQVTPYSIGIEVGGRKLSNVVRRDSEIPKIVTRTFSTCTDYQSKALVAVYEGERENSKDNACLGQVVIKNIREEPTGFPEIDVIVEASHNFNITVKVVDISSDQLGTSFKVTTETFLEKTLLDQSKTMAIIKRVRTDGRRADPDWEHVDFDPAIENRIHADRLAIADNNPVHQLNCSQPALSAFKTLPKRHSRANLFSSLGSKQKYSTNQTITSTQLHSNKTEDQSTFQEFDQHHVDLQHALAVANAALRVEKIRAENAETRVSKLEKEKEQTLRQHHYLENDLRTLRDQNKLLHEELLEASEQLTCTFAEYNRVCEILKHKEAVANKLWLLQRDEIKISGEELGRGGYGTVHKATFRGTTVAVKQMHQHISDYNCDLFEREMNIASLIRHPNLVQFIGATCTAKEEPFIVTEIMFSSVWKELQFHEFSQVETISILQGISKALNYLHLMQPEPIIHRDVSSANVLLNPGPNKTWIAKLSDYGSANYARSAVTQGPGNAAYAAPDKMQTPKIDVYSFGVLLLEMCVRRIPDSTATHSDREVLIIQISSSHLQTLIRSCTANEPSSRPTMSKIIPIMHALN